MADPKPTTLTAAPSTKVYAVEVEVQSTVHPHAPLRLTEVGGGPLKAGDKFLVPDRVARGLVERHGAHLKVTAAAKPVDRLAQGHYEFVKGGQPAVAPTDTTAPQPAAVEGQASNRAMAGKGKQKGG
jgi:hypothetical protein